MRVKLSDLSFDTTAVVREIQTPAHDLNCMGLRVGKELKMVTKQPIKGPVVVLIGELEIAMGLETAELIVVETGADA
ncbi:FeoA family protein [Methanogenium cariaci]|jgi:ferrous iron transport protein A